MISMSNFIRATGLAILGLVIFPLISSGQASGPQSRPDREPTSRPYWRWGMRGTMERAGLHLHRFEDDQQNTGEPTDQQWREISEYMKRDLPNAWRSYKRQPPARQEQMKKQIFAQFQATKELRRTNQPELYRLKLKQRKLLDEVAGLVRQWRKASLDDRPAVRQQLHEKVRLYLEALLQERDLRIKKLEAQLDKEKTRLSQDRQNLSASADARVAHLLNRNPPMEPQIDEPAPKPAPTTQRASED